MNRFSKLYDIESYFTLCGSVCMLRLLLSGLCHRWPSRPDADIEAVLVYMYITMDQVKQEGGSLNTVGQVCWGCCYLVCAIADRVHQTQIAGLSCFTCILPKTRSSRKWFLEYGRTSVLRLFWHMRCHLQYSCIYCRKEN